MTDLPVIVLPDVVQLVTAWLRAQPELSAVGSRVYSVLPAERTYPLLVAAQVADAPVTPRPWWATRADLQLSAYDLTSNGARAIVEQARGVIAARLVGAHPEGTVAYVTFANLAYLPDPGVLTPAGRPLSRWVTTMTVTVHPNP